MRLGRRQVDVLAGAEVGKAYTSHAGRGRFVVYGLTDHHHEDVLERLLELDLVEGRAYSPIGYRLRLTGLGLEALNTARRSSLAR